jgi:hypothetical protein
MLQHVVLLLQHGLLPEERETLLLLLLQKRF